jgi:cytoskeletal protein RodZ
MAEIGSTLREARMRAHIDISEVEAKTKIRAKYLRAIENEEWDLLPGPTYVKSFLKTYADYLGLDSRLLVDEYKRRYERPDHDTHTIATLHRERERAARGPLLPPWLLTVGVLVAIVGALFAVGKIFGTGSNNPSRNAGSTNTVDSHHHHRGGQTTNTVTVPTTPTTPTVATLHLVPTATVYVCVENASGHPLIPGVIYALGQSIPTVHSSKLLVTLGNNSVTAHANGKPLQIAPSASAISFTVLPSGVHMLAAGTGPSCT